MRRLVRFRVDPTRLRVSMRRLPDGEWEACVATRDDSALVARGGNTPRKALARALRAADEEGLPGVDLHMQWAYEHPWPAAP